MEKKLERIEKMLEHLRWLILNKGDMPVTTGFDAKGNATIYTGPQWPEDLPR